MGITKKDLFTSQQNEIASISKVLGHPARIAILQHLMETQSCVCGGLVDETGLAQATVSQHLRELKQIGLIKGQIEGTSVCYCIDKERWKEVQDLLMNYFQQGLIDSSCC